MCWLPLQKSQLSEVSGVLEDEVTYALENFCQGEADEGFGAPMRSDYLGLRTGERWLFRPGETSGDRNLEMFRNQESFKLEKYADRVCPGLWKIN